MKTVFGLLDNEGNCPTIVIPGREGSFRMTPIFPTIEDAQLCMDVLSAAGERTIAEMTWGLRKVTDDSHPTTRREEVDGE